MERYFRLKGVWEDEKVEVVMVALQGKAVAWFQWWEGRNQNASWTGFKGALLRRFQPEVVQNPFEVLLGLKQEGSVADYREQFEANSGPLRIGDTNYLKGIFLNGLKEEVKAELRLHRLNSLEEIMDLALLIESRNSILRKEVGGSLSTTNRGGWNKNLYGSRRDEEKKNHDEPRETKGEDNQKGEGKTNWRWMTDAEYQERWRRGICFRCEEKYSPGHVCKNKQIRIMLEEGETEEDEEEEIQWGGKPSTTTLDFRSMVGMTSKHSFKCWGKIGDNSFLVLVDCGASHNFIADSVVRKLGLVAEKTEPYWVKVGDGHSVKAQELCAGLAIEVQG
uniref:Retrotransposon gag domain-containing protein n=2 Tax=Cajanus cajan TaxID=3821 RepID=A0A151S7Y7_CAJCA|nr:hypothetical protein KK1_027260 [Cajanus cajan]